MSIPIDRCRRGSGRAPVPGVRRSRGFTLVELIVALVVAGILASVAMVSYRSFTLEARRATATTALTDAASRQEQFYLNNKTYTQDVAGGLNVPTTVDGGHYDLSVDAPTAACPIARCYVLRARPQGSQTQDDCGQLTYGSDGDRAPAGCW